MSFEPKSPAHAIRSSVGYAGTHALLLSAGIGLLFLQRYLWLLNIARQGYGPNQNASYLTGASAVIVLVDLVALRWALKGSRGERHLALIWPALFLAASLFILVANNA